MHVISFSFSRFNDHVRHAGRLRGLLAATALAAFGAFTLPSSHAAEISNIPINGMYMAYFDLNSAGDGLGWTNASEYGDNQALRPLEVTNPGDYFASGSGWADLLNPVGAGGQGASFSRYFGFSLTGDLRSYLNTNGYSIAIQLDSITYASGVNAGQDAINTNVYYFNAGSDDWGTTDPAKAAWSELSDSNYLIWNGQSFMNMLHLPVITTDNTDTAYTLTYTLSIVSNAPTSGVNAEVINGVTSVAGIDALQISYQASSQVPEPSTYAAMAGLVALGIVTLVRRGFSKCIR